MNINKFIAGAACVLLLAGCSAQRMNLSYNPAQGEVGKSKDGQLKGAIVEVSDLRDGVNTYPKQVIRHMTYRGEESYDINDRTVQEVFTDALTGELSIAGVRVVTLPEVKGPLDKETAAKLAADIREKHPDVRAAFAVKIKDFMASSEGKLVTDKVHVTGWVQFLMLDVQTGDLFQTEFKNEWDATAANASRNYMIGQLNQMLTTTMQETVRDNKTLHELIEKMKKR
ncbi:MAG TPA: hypothetical protein VGK71_09295 [Nitrospirota bacterium]|jgi:uncharacterized lipoprotein YajG